MIQLKPIQNWKFNLQIIFATVLFISCIIRASFYLFEEITDTNYDSFNTGLNYISTTLGFVLAWFLYIVLKPYQPIGNMLLLIAIIRFIVVLKTLKESIYDAGLKDNFGSQIGELVLGIFLLAAIIMLFAFVLLRKFKTIPLVRMLRPYTIATFVMAFSTIVLIFLLAYAEAIDWEYYRYWTIVYLIAGIPYIFLIIYYVRIKRIYPKLVDGTYQEQNENWPPSSTIQ